MASTVYRVEKNKNYTTISNYHLQDNNLSLKAKGLLTIILSLPPDWEITTNSLKSLSKEGDASIRAILKELETNGYLVRKRGRRLDGTMLAVQYTFLEVPDTVQGYNYLPASPFMNEEDPQKVVQMGLSDMEDAAEW
ncbi:MAG: hypothetical protein ACI4N4_02055 [Candidatus Fimenecus sp.]